MRIVSLAPSNTEILFALGLENEIVGVTAYCDEPPAARTKVIVGGWTHVPVSRVMALQPDLVCTSTFLQQPIANQLQRKGIHVCQVNPYDLDSVFESIRCIGRAVGCLQKARQLARTLQNDLRFIARQTRSVQTPPRVLVLEWEDPLMPSGNWVPQIVEIAGGTPLLAQPGRPSMPVNTHLIAQSQAEHVVFSVCGRGTRVNTQAFASHPLFKALPAVQSKHLHVMPDSWLNCPAFRLCQGARQLQQWIHPSLV